MKLEWDISNSTDKCAQGSWKCLVYFVSKSTLKITRFLSFWFILMEKNQKISDLRHIFGITYFLVFRLLKYTKNSSSLWNFKSEIFKYAFLSNFIENDRKIQKFETWSRPKIIILCSLDSQIHTKNWAQWKCKG